jgi:hypothetical protein
MYINLVDFIPKRNNYSIQGTVALIKKPFGQPCVFKAQLNLHENPF